MKDEINIKRPGQILDYVDTKEHLFDLFNYITNLQEENQEIKNTIDFIDNKYKNTINYNEKLIEYNQDYKSRIEKAIEYIKASKINRYAYALDFDTLLKILRGEL